MLGVSYYEFSWVEVGFESFMIYVSCLWMTAWGTLLERKLLAGAQRRKGPNKVSFKGALQPVADAIKLFTKEQVVPAKANVYPFCLVPPLTLSITMAMWHLWPVPCPPHFYQYGIVFYMCLSSTHVYGTVLGGWAANSVFSMYGSMRAIAMAISYEVPLAVIYLSLGMQLMTWDLNVVGKWFYCPLFLFNSWGFIVYLICSVAEMHRAPFDLVEAESELVSGYNTDYGATGFLLFYVSEYANVILGSQVMAWLWFWPVHWVWSVLVGLFITACIFLARAAYPRVKCEVFVEMCWKSYLPVSLVHLQVTFILCILV